MPAEFSTCEALNWKLMPARSTIRTFCATLFVAAFIHPAVAAPPTKPVCQAAIIEGELNAGQPFSQPIGGGLKVFFQPIHSGWILRILPASGPAGDHDY